MKKLIVIVLVLLALVSLGALSRKGYLFPALGSALNFVLSPDDIWKPLAESPVEEGVFEYPFRIDHKYPGKHVVAISVPRRDGINSFSVQPELEIEASKDGKEIYRDGNIEPIMFWGEEREGLIYFTHTFPGDIAERDGVNITLKFDSSLTLFQDTYGNAIIRISKGSDE